MSTENSPDIDQAMQDYRDYQVDLRVEIRPRIRLTEVDNVFTLGRLCNELRYHLQLAWITNQIQYPDRFDQIWGDLEIVKSSLAELHNDDDFDIEQIVHVRDAWRRSFGSESHHDILREINQQLIDERERGTQLENGRDHFDLLEQYAKTSQSILQPFLKQMRFDYDLQKQRLFNLGNSLDQLIHPPFSRRVFQVCIDSSMLDSTTDPETDLRSQPRHNLNPSYLIYDIVPNVEWPDDEWCRVFENSYQRIMSFFEISCETLPFDAQHNRHSKIHDAVVYNVSRIVNECSGFSLEEDRNAQPVSQVYSSSVLRAMRRFGLEIDCNQVIVEGFDTPIELDKRSLALFIYFLTRENEITPTEELRGNWSQIGTQDGCSEQTVHSAISELNTRLSNFDLQVKNIFQSEVRGYILDNRQ